jgi:dTDP-4-amino-4,6-dideoxygalactose transaminase
MNVPLLDLKAQHRAIREEVLARVVEVVDTQLFILGQPVLDLEAKMAELCRAPFAIGVASGTDALLLPLKALDLKPGDEVITVPFTFFASAGAIHNAGAKPVFVDIEADTYNMDPDALEAAITPRTRAIMPVHLFGQMAAMERILAVAGRHGIPVIEDAAQAIGARRRIDGTWRMAGELGAATGFSYFPSKNLGGWGDSGMVVANDERIATRVRRLRVHGGLQTYLHDEVGTNSRLDALQAAVLLAKLPHLAEWSAARRANAARYSQALAGLGAVRTPVTDPANEHIYNQYVLAVQRRDALQAHLKAHGIGTAIYYPLALHLQPCFEYLGLRKGAFPVSEAATEAVLALPVYPELSQAQQEHVVETIRGFYGD